MIADKDIPGADPAAVIEQYTTWIKKVANRYNGILEQTGAISEDDLFQVGCMALLEAQKKYNPDAGMKFMSYSFNHIRNAMRCELGFSSHRKAPDGMIYLDEPLSEDAEASRIDLIPDEAPTAEEAHIEQDRKEEIAEAVHAAIDRLKNHKYREIITRCWINGQSRSEAAEEMGMKATVLSNYDRYAREKLSRDEILINFAVPFFHVSLGKYKNTWTSAVEAAVIWREEHQGEIWKEYEKWRDRNKLPG